MEEEIIIIEEIDEEEFVVVEDDIEYISPTTQEKIIMPKTEQQIVVPDDGVFALSKVTVEAVTNEIDENIKPNNIKLGVTILGVEGNVEPDKPDQTKEVTPTREVQTITADTGYELASVKIDAIPSNYVEVAGTIDITTNGVHNVSEYENANVNVGGIEIKDASYLFYNGARTDIMNELCACISEENKTLYNAFYYANVSQTPFFDTKNVETFQNAFSYSKIKSLPQYDMSNAINSGSMCSYCSDLLEVPDLNMSKVENPQGTFNRCTKLVTVGEIDLSSASRIDSILSTCSALVNFGGFKNLGKGFEGRSANYSNCTFYLSSSTKLTHESLMNVINKLYDLAGAGFNNQQLVLGATNIAKLEATEEGQQAIALAQAKGWTVS